MATAVKRKLSGSTDGRGIKIVTVSTPGTLIHTAVSGTTLGMFDELWLYAYNSDASARLLTVEFGGVSVPDDNIKVTISPLAGLMLVVPGLVLQNASVVRAFSAVASGTVIYGFVNSITD